VNRDEAEKYTQTPGQIVAGGWRQVALGKRLGVPQAAGCAAPRAAAAGAKPLACEGDVPVELPAWVR
jgi:hypothetical protein